MSLTNQQILDNAPDKNLTHFDGNYYWQFTNESGWCRYCNPIAKLVVGEPSGSMMRLSDIEELARLERENEALKQGKANAEREFERLLDVAEECCSAKSVTDACKILNDFVSNSSFEQTAQSFAELHSELEALKAERDLSTVNHDTKMKISGILEAIEQCSPECNGTPDDLTPEFNAYCEALAAMQNYAKQLRTNAGGDL